MASSYSSLRSRTKYDVFVSFRGEDVRHGFLSHLTKELRAKHIDAYVDERLESGEKISSALVTAIEGSMISLVIFSQHYASSRWCLEELVKIMECNKVNHQIVIPVFFNVDPTDVRHQKGTYGDAFAKHEQKYYEENMDKLQSWRSSLNKAANLSGYHYPLNFENESELIDKIVKDLLNKLKDDIFSDESRRLVGFDGHFAHVESLLEIESQEVKIIGLWGMGGIGKTTLAQAVCEKFSFKFESCCFMENVREESKKINGLSYLLQKLYCQLLDLDEENLNMYDAQTKRSIRRMLSRKKVLIVLDDVETYEQLEYLVGEKIYLGRGSRVIITSRDRHVLRGVHAMHEIGELNFEESLELFSLYAFKERNPQVGFEDLSKSAVSYAKGIPLALKVLGSHLHSRNKEAWEDALRMLQKHPHTQIQHVLRVSYDGLDAQEKNIFLDIAFFFRGHPKTDVIGVLDACGFYATSGIEQLLEKALITISDDRKIKMHDLLQEMGEQIVCEESIKHPERRSRLNDIDDLNDVLQKYNGTHEIEGIVLDEGIAMQFNSSKLLQAIYSNSTDYEHIVCYPTTTIPSWFTYKETAGCPFIVELTPPSHSDQLLGFVLCGVVPQLAGSCRIFFDFFFEDGDRYWEGYSNREFELSDSKRSLAFMWFVPYNLISPKTDEGRKFDEMGCYYMCEASEEAVEGAACGVCPVYASQLDNIVAQILESNASDHDDIGNDDGDHKSASGHDDIGNDDGDHKSDEIQTQPHFQINLNRINPTPLDRQSQRKGLQLFL